MWILRDIIYILNDHCSTATFSVRKVAAFAMHWALCIARSDSFSDNFPIQTTIVLDASRPYLTLIPIDQLLKLSAPRRLWRSTLIHCLLKSSFYCLDRDPRLPDGISRAHKILMLSLPKPFLVGENTMHWHWHIHIIHLTNHHDLGQWVHVSKYTNICYAKMNKCNKQMYPCTITYRCTHMIAVLLPGAGVMASTKEPCAWWMCPKWSSLHHQTISYCEEYSSKFEPLFIGPEQHASLLMTHWWPTNLTSYERQTQRWSWLSRLAPICELNVRTTK